MEEGRRHRGGGSSTGGCASRSGEAEAAARGCASSLGTGRGCGGHGPGPAHPLAPATAGTDGPERGRGKQVAPLLQNIPRARLVQQALLMRSIILLTKRGWEGAPSSCPCLGSGEQGTGRVPGQGRRWD